MPSPEHLKTETPVNIDWPTLGLSLAAILAVGGLIPFWIYIYFALTTLR
jgi:hypothetical protein